MEHDDIFVVPKKHTDAGDDRLMHLKGILKTKFHHTVFYCCYCLFVHLFVLRCLRKRIPLQTTIFCKSSWSRKFNWRAC